MRRWGRTQTHYWRRWHIHTHTHTQTVIGDVSFLTTHRFIPGHTFPGTLCIALYRACQPRELRSSPLAWIFAPYLARAVWSVLRHDELAVIKCDNKIKIIATINVWPAEGIFYPTAAAAAAAAWSSVGFYHTLQKPGRAFAFAATGKVRVFCRYPDGRQAFAFCV